MPYERRNAGDKYATQTRCSAEAAFPSGCIQDAGRINGCKSGRRAMLSGRFLCMVRIAHGSKLYMNFLCCQPDRSLGRTAMAGHAYSARLPALCFAACCKEILDCHFRVLRIFRVCCSWYRGQDIGEDWLVCGVSGRDIWCGSSQIKTGLAYPANFRLHLGFRAGKVKHGFGTTSACNDTAAPKRLQ